MTRQEGIERLNKLPSNLIEKAYSLNIVTKKVQLQYDSFLKDLYKEKRLPLSPDLPFIYFQVDGWRIAMESEED